MPEQSETIVAKLTKELRLSHWVDTDALRREVRSRNLIDRDDPDIITEALNFYEGAMIRRVMQRKDEKGYPLFPNIVVPDKDSDKKKHVYMSRQEMKVLHYKQWAHDCHNRAVYWMTMENGAVQECNDRHHTQMEIPWPEAVTAN